MEVQAAVVWEESGPFEIETLDLEEPQAGEVLVRIVGAGVCHTDIAVRDQYYPTPLPAVLGHEGSGVVEEVGEGVTRVEPGDRVVLTFDFDDECPNCQAGHQAYCDDFFAHNFASRRVGKGSTPIHDDGEDVSGLFFGQSSFATRAIATERNVVYDGDREAFREQVREYVTRFTRYPRSVHGGTKTLVDTAFETDLDAHLERERDAIKRASDSPAFDESLSAFFEKRCPEWTAE